MLTKGKKIAVSVVETSWFKVSAMLGNGFIVTAMLWSAWLIRVIDHELKKAAGICCAAAALTITRVFAMQIRRRGFELRLVLQGSRALAPLADLALIKAIARGRQWADDLLSGRVESVAAIARREGVLPNYVRRLTRLAFLSPRIVEAIVAGHQPPELPRRL